MEEAVIAPTAVRRRDPASDTPFIRRAFSRHVLITEGYALFLEEPPTLIECRTDAESALQHYGAIVFWIHRARADA
ncbi:hypothetical protein AB0M44_42695 [Streptosporangium subroseum]|uniref:hypothetical protein n=1 Tax=Streptosporangium subroseum TaxID=106412 RepID=UPI003426073A